EEELRSERERLLPVREKWKAAEEMRRLQEERAATLAALPAAAEDVAGQKLAVAQQEFKSRQAEESHARAKHKVCGDRLRDLERLTGQMGGEPVACNLCGQEVTAAHAQAERRRLLGARKRLEGEVTAAEQGRHNAEQAVSRAQRAHEAALRNAQRRQELEQAQEKSASGLARLLQGLTPEAAQAAVQRVLELGALLEAAQQELVAHQGVMREARSGTKKA